MLGSNFRNFSFIIRKAIKDSPGLGKEETYNWLQFTFPFLEIEDV